MYDFIQTLNKVSFELVLALGVLVASATVVQHVLSSEFLKRKQRHGKDIEVIAEQVETEHKDRKAAILEVLASQDMKDSPKRIRETVQNVLIQVDRSADSISKPVELLVNNYHEQALSQARVQFWFSVVAATLGFIWILYAGTGIQADKPGTVSKTIPGIVMDAVAFLFFKQAAETRQRATELYDRLRKDKQLTESSSIVASIEDTRLRSAVKAQLALHMSGLEPKPIDLGAFLSAPAASATLTLQPVEGNAAKI